MHRHAVRREKSGFRFILLCLAVPLAAAASASTITDRQIDVIESVGVVRYFHPHDGVTRVDWNRVLHDGFVLAADAGSDEDFAKALVALFAPIGTGIVRVDEDAATTAGALRCDGDQPPVRWAHEGFAAPPAVPRARAYDSRRIGMKRTESRRYDYAVLAKYTLAEPYRGQQLALTGRLRVPEGGEAVLWIRVDGPDQETLFFDNMDDRRVDSADWTAKGLVVPIPDEALFVAFGMVVYGTVPAQFDRIQLRRFDETTDRPVGESLIEAPLEWRLTSDSQRHVHAVTEHEEGIAADLRVLPAEEAVPEDVLALFEAAPRDHFVELSDGSRLRVPLALCPEDVEMDPRAREWLWRQLPALAVEPLDASARLRLDLATLWPVFQHFYPYREVLDDWTKELAGALESVDDVVDREAHQAALERFLAGVHDGHVRVYPTEIEDETERAFLPLAIEWLDRALIVSVSGDDRVQAGDRILALDGEPAEEALAQAMARQSGSPQWRAFRAIQTLTLAPSGTRRTLGLERDGEQFEVELAHEAPQPLSSLPDGAVRSLDDGLLHVVLPRLGRDGLNGELERLSAARGLIIDLRGYPRGFEPQFLGHFLDASDEWEDPFRVLLARAPDGDLPVLRASGWGIEQRSPTIDTPVVFLTDHRALSFAESLIGFIQYHELGPVVGTPTAGANGDIIPLVLPGGFTTQYSGLRVVGADGRTFHGQGITPDIEVAPTREGLRAGRDEVLEHAVSMFDRDGARPEASLSLDRD